MSDKILSVAALVALASFLAVLVLRVPELDLAIVVALCVILAAVDFYLAAFRRRK